jgi:aspartate ammonia-lyase
MKLDRAQKDFAGSKKLLLKIYYGIKANAKLTHFTVKPWPILLAHYSNRACVFIKGK